MFTDEAQKSLLREPPGGYRVNSKGRLSREPGDLLPVIQAT